MNQYLLDTNICIYFIKGLYHLDSKLEEVGPSHCFISEITLAELKFGVANSKAKKKNHAVLDNFMSGIQILPIFPALDIYAREKARLRKSGKIIDDFDLLIGSTAIAFDLIMVTNNTRHFQRLKNIKLQDWTEKK
ncbi:MAG: type II toxin-antitoxin system VapC family toxin [Balneolaceae bacterium]|nr:type II toxin-antitoxin system VapC family toxin [Balneolaceae bacterium]